MESFTDSAKGYLYKKSPDRKKKRWKAKVREETKNRRETERGGRIKREKERRRRPRSARLTSFALFAAFLFPSLNSRAHLEPGHRRHCENFSETYIHAPFEPPPTCIYIYIYEWSPQKNKAGLASWKGFSGILELEAKCREDFPTMVPFIDSIEGVENWRGREMADRKRDVAGMLIKSISCKLLFY